MSFEIDGDDRVRWDDIGLFENFFIVSYQPRADLENEVYQFIFDSEHFSNERREQIPSFCFPFYGNGTNSKDDDITKISTDGSTFSFVLTDELGFQEFCYCRHIKDRRSKSRQNPNLLCLCLLTYMPNIELFDEILDVLIDLYEDDGDNGGALSLTPKLLTYLFGILLEAPKSSNSMSPVPDVKNKTMLQLQRYIKLMKKYPRKNNYIIENIKLKKISRNRNQTLECSVEGRLCSFTYRPRTSVLATLPTHLDMTTLYTHLDPQTVMCVLAALLHERRIVFTSSRLSRLSGCINALKYLIYPMYWQHIFIPLIPASLIEYLSAPMPFIIGLHTSLFARVRQLKIDLSEVVVVDIDAKKVHSFVDDFSALPLDLTTTVMELLRKPVMAVEQYFSRVFLDYHLSTFGNYREFIDIQFDFTKAQKIATSNSTKGKKGEDDSVVEVTFNDKLFIEKAPENLRALLVTLNELQMFQHFIFRRCSMIRSCYDKDSGQLLYHWNNEDTGSESLSNKSSIPFTQACLFEKEFDSGNYGIFGAEGLSVLKTRMVGKWQMARPKADAFANRMRESINKGKQSLEDIKNTINSHNNSINNSENNSSRSASQSSGDDFDDDRDYNSNNKVAQRHNREKDTDRYRKENDDARYRNRNLSETHDRSQRRTENSNRNNNRRGSSSSSSNNNNSNSISNKNNNSNSSNASQNEVLIDFSVDNDSSTSSTKPQSDNNLYDFDIGFQNLNTNGNNQISNNNNNNNSNKNNNGLSDLLFLSTPSSSSSSSSSSTSSTTATTATTAPLTSSILQPTSSTIMNPQMVGVNNGGGTNLSFNILNKDNNQLTLTQQQEALKIQQQLKEGRPVQPQRPARLQQQQQPNYSVSFSSLSINNNAIGTNTNIASNTQPEHSIFSPQKQSHSQQQQQQQQSSNFNLSSSSSHSSFQYQYPQRNYNQIRQEQRLQEQREQKERQEQLLKQEQQEKLRKHQFLLQQQQQVKQQQRLQVQQQQQQQRNYASSSSNPASPLMSTSRSPTMSPAPNPVRDCLSSPSSQIASPITKNSSKTTINFDLASFDPLS